MSVLTCLVPSPAGSGEMAVAGGSESATAYRPILSRRAPAGAPLPSISESVCCRWSAHHHASGLTPEGTWRGLSYARHGPSTRTPIV